MGNETDLQLIESFRRGDERAFNEIVLRYQQRIYWAARRIAGNHEDADDIVQEAFINAYSKLQSFRGDSSLYTWLYRIAVNLSLTAVRKNRLVEYFHFDSLTEGRKSTGEDPAQIALRNEERSLMEDAEKTLPAKQKAVFVLRYHEGMKFDEIASVLGKSVGGVKANYFHALRKIQQFMEKAYR